LPCIWLLHARVCQAARPAGYLKKTHLAGLGVSVEQLEASVMLCVPGELRLGCST
jgi:hypothetical protein